MAATLCQIPTFHIKLSFSPLPYRRNANHFHPPSIPRFQNSIFASIKKPRGSRQASRRNADLCNDIRDFLSVAGLPHDHIPTTNELRQHGRQDLANVVRRRGYKYIRELLGSLRKSFDGQDEKMKNSSDDVDGGINSVIDDVEFKETYFVEDSSFYPSLQEKASRFIQNGELDSINDSDFEFLNQSSATRKEHKEHGLHGGVNGVVVSNGNTLSSLQQVDHAVQEISVQKDAYRPVENKGANVKIQNVENQAEISHLKFMLHQKELELMRLKQKIEAEKNALSDMQIKAQTEMRKAHKLVSEKDAELNAAEESLSGLKEVEIQFRGNGACVEVAGSFNGWHHRIKMDPQTASSLIGSTGLRVFPLWRTILWLYPGVYEIKFVVDGHWRTDPERELVTRGAIENNVLRVER